MNPHLSLLFLFLLPLFGEESIEIQKRTTGEIQIQKSTPISTTRPRSSELKVEVIDLSTPPPSAPKIEVNPPPSEPSPSLDKIPPQPIQIRIHEGKAYVRWRGGEQEITLDSQGRFNLQIFPPANRNLK